MRGLNIHKSRKHKKDTLNVESNQKGSVNANNKANNETLLSDSLMESDFEVTDGMSSTVIFMDEDNNDSHIKDNKPASKKSIIEDDSSKKDEIVAFERFQSSLPKCQIDSACRYLPSPKQFIYFA